MGRVILWFGAVTIGFAQSRGDAALPQRLVRLTVAATDSKGDRVTDLGASDVQVREDGKVRPVVFFRFDGSKRNAAAPAPGETVNVPALTPTVLLFDRWNERLTAAAPAWFNVDSALKRMESVDRIFIYFLTNHGDLYPVHPLPASDADLRALAEPTPAELSAKLDDAVRKLEGFRDKDVQYDPVRVDTTLKALDALGTQMASIVGRKNLIWVTQGIPSAARTPGGSVDFIPQLRLFSIAAAASQIAIYAVDESARGVDADLSSLSRQTLQMLCSLTGGRWYPSDDAEPAFADALADGRGAYRLAYYSEFRLNDRKEHKIRVESSRKGLRLLTREGYFGSAVEADPDQMEQALFTSERRSPFEATDIGLRVALSAAPASGSSHFAIHVDPADVLLEQRGGNYQGELALMFALYSQGFLKDASAPMDVNIDLTPDQFRKAQTDGIDVSKDLRVGGGIDKIRVMVFDRRLFALGSVTVAPLK